MGLKGSGKTKRLVEMVSSALETSSGSVVVIEKDKKLTYDIPYQARLIYASDYSIGTIEFFKGLLSGLHAGNYDITHVFIDNLYKMFEDKSVAGAEDFLDWLEAFSRKEGICFTLTLSAPIESATERIRRFF